MPLGLFNCVRRTEVEGARRVVRAHAPRTVAMEIARLIPERIHAAEGEAAEIVRQELDRVRQTIAVHAVEVALVNRIAARPRGDVVEIDELLGHVELIAERQRAPLILQAHVRLPAELRAAECILAVAEMKAGFEHEHGLQAAA